MSAFAEELLLRFRWIGGHADVLGLLSDGEFFTHAIHALTEPFAEARVTKVAAVEARGFVFGAAVALRLGVGFVPVRKPGSVHPGPKALHVSAPDWRAARSPTRSSGPPWNRETECCSSTTGPRRGARRWPRGP